MVTSRMPSNSIHLLFIILVWLYILVINIFKNICFRLPWYRWCAVENITTPPGCFITNNLIKTNKTATLNIMISLIHFVLHK